MIYDQPPAIYGNVKVSYYGMETCQGKKVCKTASGAVFDPNKLTTACWNDFKLGTRFRVTFAGNSVDVVCSDRGNFKRLGRFLDLSEGAFKKLAPLSRGILGVRVEEIK